VAIRTNGGLSAYQSSGGTVADIKVGSHQAKQETVNLSCVIAIGVTDSSRVDVTVTPFGDQ